jgi:hypothetical protein
LKQLWYTFAKIKKLRFTKVYSQNFISQMCMVRSTFHAYTDYLTRLAKIGKHVQPPPPPPNSRKTVYFISREWASRHSSFRVSIMWCNHFPGPSEHSRHWVFCPPPLPWASCQPCYLVTANLAHNMKCYDLFFCKIKEDLKQISNYFNRPHQQKKSG